MKLLRADGHNERECVHVQTFYHRYMFSFYISEIARDLTAMLFVFLRFDNSTKAKIHPSICLSTYVCVFMFNINKRF